MWAEFIARLCDGIGGGGGGVCVCCVLCVTAVLGELLCCVHG